MLSSGAGRWVIAALLAAYAFCDGLAQYLAAATPLPAALAMPDSVTRFLQVLHAPAYTFYMQIHSIVTGLRTHEGNTLCPALFMSKACFTRMLHCTGGGGAGR